MATLYARANPMQARILRIVEGAIINAQHAHPEINISAHQRRSIAKRAAGTLSAQLRDVLALAQNERQTEPASASNAGLDWGIASPDQQPSGTGSKAARLSSTVGG